MASRRQRSASLRLLLIGRATGMAAAIAVILVAARPALAAQPAPAAGEIKILPATKEGAASAVQPLPPAPREGQPAGPAAAGPRMSYAEAFRAVGFSRAEYCANPSYRNEAALALMFGQMPYIQTIKNVPAPRINNYGYITPYRYRNAYGNGMNYNFYYPMPSVYRNY